MAAASIHSASTHYKLQSFGNHNLSKLCTKIQLLLYKRQSISITGNSGQIVGSYRQSMLSVKTARGAWTQYEGKMQRF